MNLRRVWIAGHGLCNGLCMPPRSSLAVIIFEWKLLDTDEETVRCRLSVSDYFVDLPLMLFV
jgi:hypothetical protein